MIVPTSLRWTPSYSDFCSAARFLSSYSSKTSPLFSAFSKSMSIFYYLLFNFSNSFSFFLRSRDSSTCFLNGNKFGRSTFCVLSIVNLQSALFISQSPFYYVTFSNDAQWFQLFSFLLHFLIVIFTPLVNLISLRTCLSLRSLSIWFVSEFTHPSALSFLYILILFCT